MTVWAEEAGDSHAPLVALIHGTMDRSTGMLRLSRRLDRRFRVLRYDRRGYGRSRPDPGGHPGPFGMDEQIDDLLTLLAGRQALLIGHSYGGNVALATAARHPELVTGIGAYETPLSWEPWWPATTAGSMATSSGDPADAAERFMRRMIGDAAWDALPERTRAIRRAEGSAMVGELRDLQAGAPWSPDQIRCPLIVSYGSRGAEHHHRGMRHVADRCTVSTLVVLEDCRHDAPLSHPDLFAERIVDPLASMAGAPWAA